MVSQTLARRYATAVYELARQANAVERIGDDLHQMVDSIEGDADVNRFFLAPVVSRESKERALARAFEGRVHDIALHTLLLLVRKRREALLRALLEEYRALRMSGEGLEPLAITSARPLSTAEIESIVERLENVYGRRFQARLSIDAKLVGGLRITMGDRRIDGTVAGRLEQLARTLDLRT